MLILVFDTTSEHGGGAIYRDEQCLASIANEGPPNFYSVTLFQMVDRVLGEVKLRLADMELIAVANGPGSFTGIRVGLAAAQAWAKACRRPVCGVSILEAMVDQARPKTDLAVPILDARRGEFFLGSFRRPPGDEASRFVAEEEGLVLKPGALGAFLEKSLRTGASITCLVRRHDRAAQALGGGVPESVEWADVPGGLLPSIARLALEACVPASAGGQTSSPTNVAPLVASASTSTS